MNEHLSNITINLPISVKRKLEKMASDDNKKLPAFIRSVFVTITSGVELPGPGEHVPDKPYTLDEAEKVPYKADSFRHFDHHGVTGEPSEVKSRDYSGEIDPHVLTPGKSDKWMGKFNEGE